MFSNQRNLKQMNVVNLGKVIQESVIQTLLYRCINWFEIHTEADTIHHKLAAVKAQAKHKQKSISEFILSLHDKIPAPYPGFKHFSRNLGSKNFIVTKYYIACL